MLAFPASVFLWVAGGVALLCLCALGPARTVLLGSQQCLCCALSGFACACLLLSGLPVPAFVVALLRLELLGFVWCLVLLCLRLLAVCPPVFSLSLFLAFQLLAALLLCAS